MRSLRKGTALLKYWLFCTQKWALKYLRQISKEREPSRIWTHSYSLRVHSDFCVPRCRKKARTKVLISLSLSLCSKWINFCAWRQQRATCLRKSFSRLSQHWITAETDWQWEAKKCCVVQFYSAARKHHSLGSRSSALLHSRRILKYNKPENQSLLCLLELF